MSRLTEKLAIEGQYRLECYISSGGKYIAINTELSNKLGKIEDLMEKYEIESVEDLEKILADYDDMAKAIVEMGLGVKVDFKEHEKDEKEN